MKDSTFKVLIKEALTPNFLKEEEEIRHEGQSCEEAHPGLTHEEWEFEQEKKGSPKFWQKMWRVQKEDNTVDEYGIPNIKSNPKRHAASELITFLNWPSSFYETILKVKEEDDQLKMMKRLQEIQWLTEEIKSELEKKELDNNKDLADAFVTYVEENPFGEEKEGHSLDWYTQAIETTLQMEEPAGSIALMDDLIDHLSMLFGIVQEFPKKEEHKIGFKFSKERT